MHGSAGGDEVEKQAHRDMIAASDVDDRGGRRSRNRRETAQYEEVRGEGQEEENPKETLSLHSSHLPPAPQL